MDVTINADGTMIWQPPGALFPRTLKWTCSGDVYLFQIDSIARMTLSPDGKRMSGTNGGAFNLPATAVRKSGPAVAAAAQKSEPNAPQAKPAKTSAAVTGTSNQRNAAAPADASTTNRRSAAIPAGASLGASAQAQGLYVVESAIDFNVLDKVLFDPKTKRLVLIGHTDPRFKGRQIPYLQHLAVSLRSPRPQMTLNWTPESDKRVAAFFKRMDAPVERAKLARSITQIWDGKGRITPAAQALFASWGVKATANMDVTELGAAVLQRIGKDAAARAVRAVGNYRRMDKVRGQDQAKQAAAQETWEALGLIDQLLEWQGQFRRREITEQRFMYLLAQAVCDRVDTLLELPGRPVSTEYARLTQRGMAPLTAFAPAMDKMTGPLHGVLVRGLDAMPAPSKESVLPLQDLEAALGGTPEVAPEFIGVNKRTQLARVMLEADYLGKKLLNLTGQEAVPGYVNEFAWLPAPVAGRDSVGNRRGQDALQHPREGQGRRKPSHAARL
jgi:hypothetical protein